MQKIKEIGIRHAFISVVLFAISFFLIGIIGGNCNYELLYIQILLFSITILFMRMVILNQIKIQLSLTMILLYSLLMIVLFYYFDMFDHAFDSELFKDFAKLMAGQYDLEKGIKDNSLDFADWGYLFLVGSLYQTFGQMGGSLTLYVCHLSSHLISCALIYKIAKGLIGHREALVVLALWGFNILTVYCITGGLKEPIFEFICITSSYFMYKLLQNTNIKCLLLFLLFVISSAFFRAVFPFYFILVFLSFKFIPQWINRHFGLCVIMGLLFVLAGSTIITEIYPEAVGMIKDKESQFDELGGAYVILNIVNAFISPYPSLGADALNFNLYIAPFAITHICFAFFALSGLFFSIKFKIYKLYPFISVYLLNCMMLIFVGFAMNARYHYPLWPLYYLLIPIGMTYYKKFYLYSYLVIAFSLTFLYNIR